MDLQQAAQELAAEVDLSRPCEKNRRRIKAAAALRGMTLWQVAGKIGVSGQFFSAILHGRTPPPPRYNERLQKVLGDALR